MLRPFVAGTAARIVGPGRRERAYLKRLEALGGLAERDRARAQELEFELRHYRGALETSQRVERGCQRRLDRMEDRLERREAELSEAHRVHKRLSLALGSVQREVELLRARLSIAPPGQAQAPARLTGKRPRSLWERISGRARA
jgi:chromosome segregation ATPase